MRTQGVSLSSVRLRGYGPVRGVLPESIPWDGGTIVDLAARIEGTTPAVAQWLDKSRFVVEGEIAERDVEVPAGAFVEVLPLVSGGAGLADPHGRPVHDLRIAVTSACPLSCGFCHHEGAPPPTRSMRVREVERIVRVGAALGIRYVKLTGGEPLARGDLDDLVRRIRPHVEEVSLVTSGHGWTSGPNHWPGRAWTASTSACTPWTRTGMRR